MPNREYGHQLSSSVHRNAAARDTDAGAQAISGPRAWARPRAYLPFNASQPKDARLVRGASMSEESSDYALLGTRSDSSVFDDVFGKATSRPWHSRTTHKQEIANAEVIFQSSTSSQASGHSAGKKKLLGGKNEPENRRIKAVRAIQSWARALADERVKHSTCAKSRKLHEEVRAWGNRLRQSTDPVIAQQSYEKILAILSLAPACLRSVPIGSDLRVLAPSSTFQFEGTFVVIHLHGLADFVLAMDRISARMRFMSIIDSATNGSTAPAPQIDAAEVFSTYWSLVLMCAQRFEGDPLYIGEDTAEILFPLDPSDAARSNEEKKAECQRRALTFALTLRQDFKAFSLHPSIRTKDYLQIHTGAAFGKLKLDIVGGVLRRCRAVPSGETVARARELATCAINNQVLAHTSVEFVQRHAQLPAPFVRIGKDANLATRLLKELSTWPDAGHEAAYAPAGGRIADRRVSRELSFADKSSNFSGLAKEAVQGDDLSTRSDFHPTNIEILARFSPYSVLAKVARGSFAEKLDTAQGTVTAILVDAGTKDLSADYDRVTFLQTVTLIAQRALIYGAGEIYSVKLEKSRVLLIAHFRNEQRRGAFRGLSATLRVARELFKLGLKASIGVSSGDCRIGTLGDSFRHKHAVLGSVPHLAAFLARRSVSLHRPFVILDQSTFVHLPANLSMRFGASKAFVQGFDNALQVFFPESSLFMGSENEERLELATVRNELSLLEDIRFARVADVDPIVVRRLLFDDASVSLVDEIIAATADVEQAEIIHEIVQYVAVMAAASPDIHVGILQSVLPDSCSDEDLALALRVLQVKLQVLRRVGHGVFWVNNSEKDFMPLYATLMPFFRKKAHFELARIYEGRMGPPGTWSRSNEAELEILIGSHFGQAGAEHHMLACTYINKGLSKLDGNTERVVKLSLRCSDLAHSWRRTQVREAEDAAARAMFVVGINERKRGNLYRSFAAFVACLRSYHELAPLLGTQCSERRACKIPSEAALAESPNQDACHCYSMTKDLHVGILVHFAEDQYLRELHFRGMNLCLKHRSVVISPLNCVAPGHVDETMTEVMRDGVTLECLDKSVVESAYHLATTEDSDHEREYMRLVVSSRQSANLIFNALPQLASLSKAPKSRAKPRASETTESLQTFQESSSDVAQEEKSSTKSSFCVVQ